MDQFTIKSVCKLTMTALAQLFTTSWIIILPEILFTIIPEKPKAKPKSDRNPQKIAKPKEAPIEDSRKSEVLETRKAPVISICNAGLRKHYKQDLLRTNRALTATRQQLEESKEKVTELKEQIQWKNAELKGAAEKLEESSRMYTDLVLTHKKVQKELTRANRILRRLDRAAQKTGNKQQDDPTSTESSNTETVLVVAAEVSSDEEIVHHLKVTELESQENEMGNELTDLPEPDIVEAVKETEGSSEITEEGKEESQEFNTLENSSWYRHNDRSAMLDLTKDAEEEEIEPKVKSELEVKSEPEIKVNQALVKEVETHLQTSKSSVANKATKPSTAATKDFHPLESQEINTLEDSGWDWYRKNGQSAMLDLTKDAEEKEIEPKEKSEPEVKSEPEIKVNQAVVKVVETLQTSKSSVPNKPSTAATKDFHPLSRKPKKKGFLTRNGILKSNTIDTTEKMPKIKLDKMKSLDVSMNGQVTTMYVDKGNFYSAINMDFWTELGCPKLESLSKEWIKKYGNYKFLKVADFKGYFNAHIKLTEDGNICTVFCLTKARLQI
ncbi:cylicin-1-like [Daphnia pulex]|uniref:cylicin-1-like n=1 Tax=Daphnia pulex TaxID=6669 RepID=UPI001EDEA7FB|nr:cylicin-1-like [Daphnia pulex]